VGRPNRLAYACGLRNRESWRTIIGVVGNVRQTNLELSPFQRYMSRFHRPPTISTGHISGRALQSASE